MQGTIIILLLGSKILLLIVAYFSHFCKLLIFYQLIAIIGLRLPIMVINYYNINSSFINKGNYLSSCGLDKTAL